MKLWYSSLTPRVIRMSVFAFPLFYAICGVFWKVPFYWFKFPGLGMITRNDMWATQYEISTCWWHAKLQITFQLVDVWSAWRRAFPTDSRAQINAGLCKIRDVACANELLLGPSAPWLMRVWTFAEKHSPDWGCPWVVYLQLVLSRGSTGLMISVRFVGTAQTRQPYIATDIRKLSCSEYVIRQSIKIAYYSCETSNTGCREKFSKFVMEGINKIYFTHSKRNFLTKNSFNTPLTRQNRIILQSSVTIK